MSTEIVREDAARATSLRHWIGLAVVYLLIPLVLLICGGDLVWWQGWLYSVLIFAAGIGGTCGRNGDIPD